MTFFPWRPYLVPPTCPSPYIRGTEYGRLGKNVIMIFIQNEIPNSFLVGNHPLYEPLVDLGYAPHYWGMAPRRKLSEISISKFLSRL